MPVGWNEPERRHRIEDEGIELQDKREINFIGAGVAVTENDEEIIVNIPGGIASLPDHDHTGDPADGGALAAYSASGHNHDAAYYTEAEVDDLISSVSVSPTGSFLVEGGNVVWESGLTFRVSAARYYINSVLYQSTEQTVTLDAADPADDRIDVIALNTASAVVKISGTAAASPSRPDVDPFSQLHLTFVLIPAGSATPGDVATSVLYQENAGAPTEWIASDSGANVNPDSVSNPRSGTKDIEFTTATNSDWVNLATGTAINLANYESLVLYIRSKAAWPGAKSIRVSFRSSGVVVGNYVSIDDGLYGFDSSVVGSYQQIAIPLSVFAIVPSTTVNSIRFEIRGGGAAIGFYLDDIFLQSGVAPGAVGITLEEADARYVQKSELFRYYTFSPPVEDLEVAAGTYRIYNRTGVDLTIDEVYASVDSAPTGANVIFDVNEDATSIWNVTPANRVTIVAGAFTGAQTAFDNPTWSAGSYLTVDTDQIGSTLPGSNATIMIKCH